MCPLCLFVSLLSDTIYFIMALVWGWVRLILWVYYLICFRLYLNLNFKYLSSVYYPGHCPVFEENSIHILLIKKICFLPTSTCCMLCYSGFLNVILQHWANKIQFTSNVLCVKLKDIYLWHFYLSRSRLVSCTAYTKLTGGSTVQENIISPVHSNSRTEICNCPQLKRWALSVLSNGQMATQWFQWKCHSHNSVTKNIQNTQHVWYQLAT